jgi:hypothetical protein
MYILHTQKKERKKKKEKKVRYIHSNQKDADLILNLHVLLFGRYK